MKNYNGLNKMIIDCIKELFTRNSIDGAEDIDLETNLNELGLDSLDQVELIIDIENKFNISIPDDDINKFDNCTVNDIIIYFKDKFDIVDIKQDRFDKLINLNKQI